MLHEQRTKTTRTLASTMLSRTMKNLLQHVNYFEGAIFAQSVKIYFIGVTKLRYPLFSLFLWTLLFANSMIIFHFFIGHLSSFSTTICPLFSSIFPLFHSMTFFIRIGRFSRFPLVKMFVSSRNNLCDKKVCTFLQPRNFLNFIKIEFKAMASGLFLLGSLRKISLDEKSHWI